MRNLFYIMTALLALTACDRSHDGSLDKSYETQIEDIVTYTGLDKDNHATFRLDGRDDNPAVMLYSKVAAPEKVKVNERVLLFYTIKHQAPDGSYWDIDAMADAIYAIVKYPAMYKSLHELGQDEVNHIRWYDAGLKVRRIYDGVINHTL